MKDDHFKTIADLYQEGKPSEKEKNEDGRQLKQSFQEQEMHSQESEEKIRLVRHKNVF